MLYAANVVDQSSAATMNSNMNWSTLPSKLSQIVLSAMNPKSVCVRSTTTSRKLHQQQLNHHHQHQPSQLQPKPNNPVPMKRMLQLRKEETCQFGVCGPTAPMASSTLARVTDTDAPSYQKTDPAKVLEKQEREKKRKCLEPCLAQRRNFTPFAASVDGLLGKEAKTLCKRLASELSGKWKRPCSVACGCVKARISVTLIRATHLTLRGSRAPTRTIVRPTIADGAGLLPKEWQILKCFVLQVCVMQCKMHACVCSISHNKEK